jgi:hypothetical protein
MEADSGVKPPIFIERCPYCGSANIIRHIKIDQTADAGNIGIQYHTRFLLYGTEPIFTDLCDECGSLLRIFVDNPRKRWAQKK